MRHQLYALVPPGHEQSALELAKLLPLNPDHYGAPAGYTLEVTAVEHILEITVIGPDSAGVEGPLAAKAVGKALIRRGLTCRWEREHFHSSDSSPQLLPPAKAGQKNGPGDRVVALLREGPLTLMQLAIRLGYTKSKMEGLVNLLVRAGLVVAKNNLYELTDRAENPAANVPPLRNRYNGDWTARTPSLLAILRVLLASPQCPLTMEEVESKTGLSRSVVYGVLRRGEYHRYVAVTKSTAKGTYLQYALTTEGRDKAQFLVEQSN